MYPFVFDSVKDPGDATLLGVDFSGGVVLFNQFLFKIKKEHNRNNANMIIADEPTGNIDPEMSYEIVDLLNHINANGTTVVMVTHEHELVRRFNHRVITISQGEVVSDTAEKQFEELASPHEAEEETIVYETQAELKEAVEQELLEDVNQFREEVKAIEIVEDKPATSFYVQPNSDKELEEFMKTYGVDEPVSTDDADDVNGGDAQ